MSTELNDLIRRRDDLNSAVNAAIALNWLLQYGLQGIEGDYPHKFAVEMRTGSACNGAKEAQVYLNDAARYMGPKIIEHAIENAEAALAKVEQS